MALIQSSKTKILFFFLYLYHEGQSVFFFLQMLYAMKADTMRRSYPTEMCKQEMCNMIRLQFGFTGQLKCHIVHYCISKQTTIKFPLNVYWLMEFTPLLAASDLMAEYCRVMSYILQLKKSSCLPYDHKILLILFFGFFGSSLKIIVMWFV